MADNLKQTPLYQEHVAAGAKIVPFAGYEMPVQYPTGILAEHQAVRTRAGLFDVCHMGELEIKGPQALDLLQHVMTNDVSKLEVGQCQYSVICYEDGGCVDDCIIYKFEDSYMVVVNASNKDKDRDWIWHHADKFDVELEDKSDDIALIALQGPRSQKIMAPLTDTDLDSIKYYHFGTGTVAGVPGIISRTGYTGEDGFELYINTRDAVKLWQALMAAGSTEGLIPAGLGSRDSLRLEMGYALYGNDIDNMHTPLEAGLGWVTKLDKGKFIGSLALQQQKSDGVRQKLVAFELSERGFPRHGYEVRYQGQPSGVVTSGTVSPSLEKGIGLAYVATEAAKVGTELEIMVRDKALKAVVTKIPFYKEGTARKS